MPIRVELPAALRARWRIGPRLGKGGQGEVYLLHSQAAQPDAVIKFLLSHDTYSVERFRREVAALATISHPNVIRIIEHETDPVPFYVAPKGEPLDKFWPTIRELCNAAELFDRSARMIGNPFTSDVAASGSAGLTWSAS